MTYPRKAGATIKSQRKKSRPAPENKKKIKRPCGAEPNKFREKART